MTTMLQFPDQAVPIALEEGWIDCRDEFRLAVPKVTGFYPVGAPVDGYSGFHVAELAAGVRSKVLFLRGEGVAEA